MRSARWVGFDVDECLGSFMPLWSYVQYLPNAKADAMLTQIAQRLSDVNSLWLFRPGLDSILAALLQAQKGGKITGCFLLSNNASARLIECIRRYLNDRAWKITTRLYSATERPGNAKTLFWYGWHRTAACRNRSEVKSWETIQHCLKSVHAPLPTSHRDVLFFDDMSHKLQQEIPHYIQVPPYENVTPHALVFREIKGLFQNEGIPTRDVYEDGESYERQNESPTTLRPPKQDDSHLFLEGIQQFLEDSPSIGGNRKKTRRTSKKGKLTRRQNLKGPRGSKAPSLPFNSF
jgi:hypothetical protein